MTHVRIAGTKVQNSSATSVAVDIPIAVPAGHTLQIAVGFESTAGSVPTITSVTDPRGNTYTTTPEASGNAGVTVCAVILRGNITTPLQAGDDITITISVARIRWLIQVDEFDDVRASSPLDKIASNAPGSSSSLSTGTTAATAEANELVYAVFGLGGGRTMSGPSSPWVAGPYLQTAAGSAERAIWVAHRYVSATGTQSAATSITAGGASTYVGVIATFTLDPTSQTVPVGLTTVTDSAQAVAVSKSRAVGQLTETDTAQPVTRSKRGAAGLNSETDLAQPVTKAKRRATGLTTESDIAQPVGHAKSRAVGQPTEADLAQAVARRKGRAVGLTTQADTAQAVGRRKSRSVGLAGTTDTANPVSRSKRVTLGLATETDAALPLTDSQQAQLGLAAETDTALAVTRRKNRAAGQAAEVDSALAVTRSKARSVALTGQIDLALPFMSAKRVVLGIAVDTSTALPAGRRKTRSAGLATEADTVLALSIGDGSTTTPPRHTGTTEYALAGMTSPRNTGTTPPR